MPVNNDLTSGLVAALRRHEPRAADAMVDTYGGCAEPPRAHILEACPTTRPRRTSNKQAVGGTNDGYDDSGSADPPPRHLRQGRSHRSHGRLLTRVAAVHPERDVEGARGHSATVHDAVQGVRQARSVVPDAEAGRGRGHCLHPLEGRVGGRPLRDRDGDLRATRALRAVPRCWSLAVAVTWSRFLSLLVVGPPHARRRDGDLAGERSNS